jgi:hypothetical protein
LNHHLSFQKRRCVYLKADNIPLREYECRTAR